MRSARKQTRARSRQGTAARHALVVLSALLGVLAVWLPGSARAELSGAVSGHGLFGLDQRKGGALSVDLWANRGMFRVGGMFGIGALSSEPDDAQVSSRVFTPLALSLAFVPSGEGSGFVAVVRGGAYAGAEKGGFIGGGFASGSVGYALALGEGASLRLLGDAFGLVGQNGGVFFGPSLSLGF